MTRKKWKRLDTGALFWFLRSSHAREPICYILKMPKSGEILTSWWTLTSGTGHHGRAAKENWKESMYSWLWTPVLFCRGDVGYIIWCEDRVSSQLAVNHLQSSLVGLRPRQAGKATYPKDSAVTSLFDLKDKRDVFTSCANCYIRQSQNSNVQSGVRQVAFHIVIQGSSSFSEVLLSSTQDHPGIIHQRMGEAGRELP